MGLSYSKVNVFHAKLNSAKDVTPIRTYVLNVRKAIILVKVFANLV